MSKKIRKSEVIDMEDYTTKDEILEENETTKVGKPKRSLKKKLLIGGGIVVGLILGAVALSSKKTVPAVDQIEDSDNDDEEVTDVAEVLEEMAENVDGVTVTTF